MADPADRTDQERTATRRARHLDRPKRDDTDDPRRSRERALKILFQADLRGVSAAELLQQVDTDADTRAMLDDLDDLDGATETTTREAPAAATSGGPTETEAQRIWREERERAEQSGVAASAPERTAGGLPDAAGGPLDGSADAGGVPPVDEFTHKLVRGVVEDGAVIDELISRFARRWSISRMPVVDRTVLRLATYELLRERTAPAVVINEAVDLAKSLSTDDSGRYVNGVLESIRKEIAELRATEERS